MVAAPKTALLFDLGNTLVQYWERAEFPGILRQAITEVSDYLDQRGLLGVSAPELWERVEGENHESPDRHVRPLAGRLARIFDIEAAVCLDELLEAMCRRFMVPIYARGRLYADSLSALEEARARGMRTAIVSNTPWGSPARLWREEIARLGLRQRVDVDVFCDDVGWRKPARQIFEYTCSRLQVKAEQCVFVGDDPRWDLVGPRAVGIEAILIERREAGRSLEEAPIRGLHELWDRIDLR
jgi:putative hydrolase of the HAD superfamily